MVEGEPDEGEPDEGAHFSWVGAVPYSGDGLRN